ncbi:hypothetical protein [Nocardia macrotermitis]|uniref:Uncharacterized protein n=1 Tax=Nocardia macrotermitis TaxID=2585198 RepID=A0A7K0D5J2_9NOCA|nr:hypothetical protein [Nocardia macrotermitis]MQY21000.1 hypothetical protein [Nocardia macrotermitis]
MRVDAPRQPILLFRFHTDPEVARERLRLIRHFDPDLRRYVLFSGDRAHADAAHAATAGLADGFWCFDDERRDRQWLWRHGDLVLKAWHRAVGKYLEFDHLYYHEYDLLVAASMRSAFAPAAESAVHVGALRELTPDIYDYCHWTSGRERTNFHRFEERMHRRFGTARQKYVCIAPGMRLPKAFLDAYGDEEDIEFVNDEVRIPAYAEALGFTLTAHLMNPGFGDVGSELRYFNCGNDGHPDMSDVVDVLTSRTDRRWFHPVKYLVTLEDLPESVRESR